MKKATLVLLFAVMLSALFAFGASAEVQLQEYHARYLQDTDRFTEYTSLIYGFGYQQFSQPIDSNGFLDAFSIANNRPAAVPATGDVLLVFIQNQIYAKPGETGFVYRYSDKSKLNVPLPNLKAALSTFPGKVALIVYSDASAVDGAAFNQALSDTFSEPKYTIVSFMVNKQTGGTNIQNVCKALGFRIKGAYVRPLDNIYADADKNRIVTSGELYNYLQNLYKGNALGLFKGENFPAYFSTKRVRIELPEKTHALAGRESFKIVPIVEPAGATHAMSWASSSPKVATVKDGVVTGVNPGKATIFLKADGKTLRMAVTVGKVGATKVSVTPWPIDVYVGWRFKMSTTIEPIAATDDVVSWASSDKKVATVDNQGVVRTLKDGTTTLTVKTSHNVKGQYTLTVIKQPVDHLEIDDLSPEQPPYETNGTVGFTRRYKPIVWPQDASFQGLRWTSSMPSVASVRSNGTISYKKPGHTVITVTSVDNPSACIEFGVTVQVNQLSWNAPVLADFAGKEAGLYMLPKRLYYSGSTLMAEVYLFNYTDRTVKSLPPFYAAVVDLDNAAVLFRKLVKGYTFSPSIAPGKTGIYKFASEKKKIDLHRNNYLPVIFSP